MTREAPHVMYRRSQAMISADVSFRRPLQMPVTYYTCVPIVYASIASNTAYGVCKSYILDTIWNNVYSYKRSSFSDTMSMA